MPSGRRRQQPDAPPPVFFLDRGLGRRMVAETTLRVFAFTNANLTGTEMVDRLGTNFNRILQRAKKPGPYVWAITPDGLERRWPRD